MDEIVKIELKDYEKKADGSWITVNNSDIVTKAGSVIRIAPGMSFRPGVKPWGFDVAQVLDEISAKS